jgi:hypothetical protein
VASEPVLFLIAQEVCSSKTATLANTSESFLSELELDAKTFKSKLKELFTKHPGSSILYLG